MSFKVIIPARFESTRLPGKVLQEIAGKPMVQHVHERAMESGAEEVYIATDSMRVADVCTGFGAQVCMTSRDHRTGTDRLAEVVGKLGEPDNRIIVNVQGDEPLLPAMLIRQVAANLESRPQVEIATLCRRITLRKELFDPHVVKVIPDNEGFALYFSRAPIPWHRDEFMEDRSELPPDSHHFRHIGLYAYRVAYLGFYAAHAPCSLELAESLEQLRALYSGHRIHVAEAVTEPGAGVDTPADLERVRELLL
ncbi:MAG: 3-deoxy-manno-octulosonate cytidylyltransferase [Gammaproteobacteria bacterium]|nr:3-deoxy-manno-octulosonate cytidylyltransferase [Gammaproteobacteria bacterium]